MGRSSLNIYFIIPYLMYLMCLTHFITCNLTHVQKVLFQSIYFSFHFHTLFTMDSQNPPYGPAPAGAPNASNRTISLASGPNRALSSAGSSSALNSAAQSRSTSQATATVYEIQPTVRVMRLYKPNMPLVPTIPPLAKPTDCVNFAISPNFLLPDNFGEIFVGENFSAYVSIVGTDSAVNSVTVSVKLQTANETIDLVDKYQSADLPSGFVSVLNPNQYLDMVVQHRLGESGSHTLRVIVNYYTQRNEAKILKKFYRFNVVEPASVSSTAVDLPDRYMIQCQVTNLTKQLMSLEKTEFLTYGGASVTYISQKKKSADEVDALPLDICPTVGPNETYAYTVSVQKGDSASAAVRIGWPEVTWSVSMGECGVMKGKDVVVTQKFANRISVRCLKAPAEAVVGKDFEVTILISNRTASTILGVLICGRPEVFAAMSATTALMSPGGPSNGSSSPKRLMPKNTFSTAPTPAIAPNLKSSSSTTEKQAHVALTAAMSSLGILSPGGPTPQLQSDASTGLTVSGLSCFDLGRLTEEESVELKLTVTPLLSGLQRLENFLVWDRMSGTLYKVDEVLATVFVKAE